MLTGAELLNRVKELGDCAKTDLARGCGYVVKKKDGSEQVKFTAFYEALLEAKGLSFSTGGSGVGKGGRKLSYKAVVQGNGNLERPTPPCWNCSPAMNMRSSLDASRSA